jgi:hypothetical protein
MADDFGRVNPVSPHVPDRGAREEPYHGRHPKKHFPQPRHSADGDVEDFPDDRSGEPGARNHIDLRV